MFAYQRVLYSISIPLILYYINIPIHRLIRSWMDRWGFWLPAWTFPESVGRNMPQAIGDMFIHPIGNTGIPIVDKYIPMDS